MHELQDKKRTDYMYEESSVVQMSRTKKNSRGNVMPWSKRGSCNLEFLVEGLSPPIPRQI